MSRFRGKVAIVTGATDGIGASVARLLADDGARIVGVARRTEPGKRLVAELGAKRSVFVQGDVAEAGTAERAVAAAAQRFGAVDVLVNNAGADLSGPTVIETTESDARRVLEVNLLGALWMLQAGARAMLGRGGAIVNVGSRTGVVGVPTMALYGATKAALLSLTRTAAIELAPRQHSRQCRRTGSNGNAARAGVDRRAARPRRLSRVTDGNDSAGAVCSPRGDRRSHPLPRLGRGRPCHGHHASGRWWVHRALRLGLCVPRTAVPARRAQIAHNSP